MIHWDWVWTVLIAGTGVSTVSAIWSLIIEPIKTERMKAEAALLENKRLNRKAGVGTQV